MTGSANPDLRFIQAPRSNDPGLLCRAVAEGLSQPEKQLPCRFFYDTVGSELFERICRLPEYYLTRTEQALLQQRAPEMLAACGRGLTLVEFGSGSSYKTRILLQAALDRQPRVHYIPIDISTEFLRASALALMDEYERVSITAIAGEYRDGIEVLPAREGPRLILFLGSNIGNFEFEEAIDFLALCRRRMDASDRLLIGADLVKDRNVLHAAYNDSLGVTAAFNKNLLTRINRELGADFDLAAFAHAAPFVEARSRIEMRLVSRCAQTVRIAALEREFAFEEGESIHTENSHKYTLGSLAALCRDAGFRIQEQWLDSREWFAVALLRPV